MSWGIRIAVLYLGFVSLIITLVVLCFGHKTELESQDYYVRELKFQEQIDAARNSNDLVEPIAYKVMDRAVQVTIPREILKTGMSGTVYFMRPSDSTRDKVIPLNTDDDGVQTIDAGFVKGVYKMKITVNSGNRKYYKETVINFN